MSLKKEIMIELTKVMGHDRMNTKHQVMRNTRGAAMNQDHFSQNFRFFEICHEHSYSWLTESCPRHILGYMCRGHGKLFFADSCVDISEGDVFYIPQGIRYHSSWSGEGGTVFHYYGFSLIPTNDRKDFCLQKLDIPSALAARVRDIPTNLPIDSKIIGTFYTVLADLFPYMAYEQKGRRESLCDRALMYMAEHIDCTVEEVAKHCHVCESVIYSAFRKTMATTPNAQRLRLLCDRATELLMTTDCPIEEISAKLGFSSSSYFRKVLHAHTGMTPTEIRKKRYL